MVAKPVAAGIADVGDADPTIVEAGCAMVVPSVQSSLPQAAADAVVGLSMALRNWRMATDIRYRGQSGPIRCRKCSDPRFFARTIHRQLAGNSPAW